MEMESVNLKRKHNEEMEKLQDIVRLLNYFMQEIKKPSS